MSPTLLPPVPQPVALFDQFIARQPETLVLKEKVMSLSGDSFDVKLASGQPIFKIEGKHLTISGRKAVSDMSGNHLFDIVKEHLHIHSTYVAEAPGGKKLLEVKSHLSLIGSKTTATFTSNIGKAVTLKMKGNWLDTKADIVDEATGMVIAEIHRHAIRGRDLVFDKQTYNVVVAPGVDMALVVALCVSFDEKNNESD